MKSPENTQEKHIAESNDKLGWRLKSIVVFICFFAICLFIKDWSVRLDCTSDKRYTLSQEARLILKDVKKNVVIRCYFTESVNDVPLYLQDYQKRVKDVLENIVKLSDGKVVVEYLDPSPDTDAESKVKLDDLPPASSNGSTDIYMGMVLTCVDQKKVMPFLNPQQESSLEYDIVTSINSVSNFTKNKIGIYSKLPVFGFGQNYSAAPFIHKLRERYDVVEIEDSGEGISDLDLLIVMHPQRPTAEFDQAVRNYRKKGGAVIAMMDPVAVSWLFYKEAISSANMMSEWPLLEEMTGLQFTAKQVVLDMRYRDEVDRGYGMEELNFFLSIDQSGVNGSHAITSQIQNLRFICAGAFRGKLNEGFTAVELVRSSQDAMLYSQPEKLANDSPEIGGELMDEFKSDDRTYSFSILLESKDKNSGGSMILIGDTDFISGPIPGDIEKLQGKDVFKADGSNDNMAYMMNAIDYLGNSEQIGSLRSKSLVKRSFDKVLDIQREAESKYATQISELNKLQRDYQKSIEEMQLSRSRGADTQIAFSEDVQNKLKNMQILREGARRDLRTIRRQQEQAVRSVESKFKWLNIGLVPIIVALFASLILWRRAVATHAI